MDNDTKGQDPDICWQNIFECFTDCNGTKGNYTLTFFKFKNECYQWLQREKLGS